MATDKLTIWNRAVANCGQVDAVEILVDSELTNNARIVRRYWDETLAEFLEISWWSFATSFATLVEATDDPPAQWQYAFDPPADMIAPRKIVGFHPDQRPPFKTGVAVGGSDQVIWTNYGAEPVLEYTASVTDYADWTAAAVNALALKLAVDMIANYSGDKKDRIDLEAKFERALEAALVGSLNREHEDENQTTQELTDFAHGTVPLPRQGSWIDDG